MFIYRHTYIFALKIPRNSVRYYFFVVAPVATQLVFVSITSYMENCSLEGLDYKAFLEFFLPRVCQTHDPNIRKRKLCLIIDILELILFYLGGGGVKKQRTTINPSAVSEGRGPGSPKFMTLFLSIPDMS